MNESVRLIMWAIVWILNGVALVLVPNEWMWLLYLQFGYYSFCYYMFLGDSWNQEKEDE